MYFKFVNQYIGLQMESSVVGHCQIAQMESMFVGHFVVKLLKWSLCSWDILNSL